MESVLYRVFLLQRALTKDGLFCRRDISNYKNIKVPTSYMAVNSRFNFEGGYENDTRAGMLHVANHIFLRVKNSGLGGMGFWSCMGS